MERQPAATRAGAPPGPINQQNVANALNGYFNSGGTLPPAFLTVYGLGGAGLSSALNQLSGEPGAAVANAGSQSLAPFMDALFDRLTDIGSGNEIQPAQLSGVSGVRTWASAFGGHEHAQGDTNAGSHASHSDVLGLAAGVDTELMPGWSLGASLAAGRLHFGVAQGLGRGESDVIELGGYTYRDLGDRTYLIGALAYAWHDMATQRLLSIGGSNTQLSASFNAQNYGLRLEGGKHLPLDGALTITPYAGLQWDEFDTPTYQEGAPSGFASYALGYLAHGSPRSDTVLGARLSNATDDNNDMLTWDGHLAWQHNLDTKETSHAAFLALPGTDFSVNGSSLDSNVALIGADLTLNPQGQISFGAKIDTSIGPHTQTIFGSLTFSHDW